MLRILLLGSATALSVIALGYLVLFAIIPVAFLVLLFSRNKQKKTNA